MSDDADSTIRRTLDRLVRRERGRLMAGLAARLGPARLDLAEDVAQDAVLQALSAWSYSGIPDNPGAWLARVARNKAVDRLRRQSRETDLDPDRAPSFEANEPDAASDDIADPELRLLILCCTPVLTRMEQLALALKLAGGFTAREIATIFLAREAAIGQRLARAKRKLASAGASAPDGLVTVFDLKARAPVVLDAVHLLFGLGYAPRTGDRLVREDLCLEALRLACLAAGHPATKGPDADALAALLCFQSSRLATRVASDGALVLLRDQDRRHWDRGLIRDGLAFLARARGANRPTPFHLEAAIAAAHATAPDYAATDWTGIRRLYDALEALTGSPVAAVNGCVAQAMAGDPAGALARLEWVAADPRLTPYPLVHLARAEVLVLLDRHAEAAEALARVVRADVSSPVRRFLEARRAGLADGAQSLHAGPVPL